MRLQTAAVLVSVCVTVAARPQTPLALPQGRTLVCAAASGDAEKQVSVCRLHGHGARGRVMLPLNAMVAKGTVPELRLVDAAGGRVIVVDSYASAPLGLSECQAGTESFVRVLAAAKGSMTVVLTEPLESCRRNLELAEDGVAWDAATATLRLHWLSGPDGVEKRSEIHVGRPAQKLP